MKLRRVLFHIHLYTGLVVGLLLSLTGLTGSLLVFSHEIDAWLYPQLLHSRPVAPGQVIIPPDQVLQAIREQEPKATVQFLAPPRKPDGVYQAYLKGGRRAQVDPYSGALLGVRSPTGHPVGFLFDLHTKLLSGDNGEQVVGVGGLLLLLLGVTGVYLWWPKKGLREGLTVQWQGSWKRVNWDLHRVGGVLVVVFLSLIALTGATLVWSQPVTDCTYRITNTPPRPKLASRPRPGKEPLPLADLDSRADAVLPGAQTTRITLAAKPTATVVIRKKFPRELHPNGMILRAYDAAAALLLEGTYYSTGGGFVASEAQLLRPSENDRITAGTAVPYPFGSAEELLEMCEDAGLGIAELVLANEDTLRPREETEAGLDRIAEAMDACIDRGLVQEGILPGGLQVHRRAPGLWRSLQANPQSNEREQLFDWLNCYAMAVNEENAAGGRVVTAPTNGAAGIIPAVMRFYCENEGEACQDRRRRFLLTAGAIGLLYKQRASISGAEMGCQGEVGVACSMAAGGLAAVWGASPAQVACAAEIGMEHNLGLTCDPVGGLVQVPCIERNAIGAVKAVNAARLALHRSEANTCVSLDQVIETMRQTGLDMSSKYKETSQGGLAVNVIEC